MTYFNKPAADLTPAEAAMLAGLPQAPSYYDPWRNPTAVRARRSIVLDAMVREGYLSQEQAQSIDASPLGVVARPVVPASRDSAFVDDAVMNWLDAHGYHHMSADGLIVTTTLDSTRQAEAARDLAEIVPSLADRGVNDGAALAADPRTGAILVWVAGSPLDGQPLTQIDLVDQWPHQPGSAIKPLLYSCALEEGYLRPNEKLDDTQRVIGGKYVANWDLHGHGILPATEALAQSSNVAAAELADRLTPQGFADCLHSVFGVQANLQASQIGVFLGLGLAEIPMPELVAAFTPLANAGLYHPLVPVARLQEPDGREIYHLEPGGDPVVSCKTVNWLAEPLGEVSQIIGLPPTLATKTGTTPASSFAIGYGRDVIFAAWVGNVTNGSISLALDDVFGKEGGGQVWKAWAQRFELGSQHSVVGCK
jgi:penicillin-binding protein 1A